MDELDVVKAKQVYTMDTTLWIAYYDPIVLNLLIDYMEKSWL
ncbi:hypothetical protein [Paenibacillus sp. PCH8]|nr:hypothetical protein [Paenibacillus sp. PCH8]